MKKNIKSILVRYSSDIFQQAQIDEIRARGINLFVEKVGENEFFAWCRYTKDDSWELIDDNIVYHSYDEAVKATIKMATEETK